ncbi:MAG: membrane protein [Peptococcaceae bacterium BRH_c4b]|nr:MAG: membrane protein [Peptococcaceae bacterium BRH_c4b]
MEYLAILMKIFMVNVVLSGDNAVVIALACRKLPSKQQKMAILLGSGGAVIFRVILTIVIVYLLRIPFLQAIGGLLLVYIAVKLLKDEESGEDVKSADSMYEAMKVIIVADLIMSLDNTLAIAAVCEGNWLMLIIGLATSIPLIIFGAQIIMYLMKRFPIILYIGAGILGWTSGEMLVGDKKVLDYLHHNVAASTVHIIDIAVPVVITAFVILYGWLGNKKAKREEAGHETNI